MSVKTAPQNTPPAKARLTTGPVVNHLVRLSLPMILGIMAFVSFQLADIFYISRLGALPLAAISFTMPVGMALFNLFIGIAIATSSVLSRLIGENEDEKVRRITKHALLIAFLTALISSLIAMLAMKPLFTAMGADSATYPLIHSYMMIWLWSNLFIAVPIAGNAAMRASGDSMTPALILNIAAIMNIVLDPFLIFGIGWFPRMELEGAALATLISQFCAMLTSLYILRFRKKMIAGKNWHMNEFGDSLKRLSFIAIPAGFTGLVPSIVNGFLLSLLAAGGTAAVAAFGVATRLEAFIFVVLMGLATGMGPVIGQNWGARQYGRVYETLRKAFLFMVIWSVVAAAILGIFAKPLAEIFSTDPEITRIIALYFLVVPFSYAFGNIGTGWSSAMNALGMPMHSVVITLIKSFVLTIPAAYIASIYFGYEGIFWSIAGTNIVIGIGAHFWGWHSCRSREKSLLAEKTV